MSLEQYFIEIAKKINKVQCGLRTITAELIDKAISIPEGFAASERKVILIDLWGKCMLSTFSNNLNFLMSEKSENIFY